MWWEYVIVAVVAVAAVALLARAVIRGTTGRGACGCGYRPQCSADQGQCDVPKDAVPHRCVDDE
jgi:hypothetical protein